MEFGIENVPCSSWKVANDIWLTEWNYQITTKLERSEKMKLTNTWQSWRLTPSNKWKWKTRFEKNISGELENYSRQNSPAETLTEPFLMWTRDELKQMDQRSRKPMTMKKHYVPETTLTDYMYLVKRGEEDLPASKTALTHHYNGSKTT